MTIFDKFTTYWIFQADSVSIVSFNQWHEGTQIEPAIKYTDTNGTGFEYSGYEKSPQQYLEITLEMVKTYFTPHNKDIPAQFSQIVWIIIAFLRVLLWLIVCLIFHGISRIFEIFYFTHILFPPVFSSSLHRVIYLICIS